MGGYLYPSVLRSPGVSPQKCRAAHGPRHPAVTIPPRLCLIGDWFFVRCFRDICLVCLYGMFGLWGRDVVWFGALQDLPLVRIGVRCPLFLLWLLGMFVDDAFLSVSLSLSLSLRRWGNPNPFGVCVSPSVSSSWTRTPTPTRTPAPHLPQGFAPHLFFFFSRRRRSFAGWVFFLVSCLGSGWFFRGWVWVGLFRWVLCALRVQDLFCIACRLGKEQRR